MYVNTKPRNDGIGTHERDSVLMTFSYEFGRLSWLEINTNLDISIQYYLIYAFLYVNLYSVRADTIVKTPPF